MQYTRHNNARKLFREIDANPRNYLIIHYSCESFYDIKDGHTPRITSIAVYSYATAQTDSFSIHKMAEKSHVDFSDIENHYDELEKAMLEEFFEYAKEHKTYFWIHWNMRDMNYGFKAIEHRYSVLGGDPYKISDENKIDLARQLISCYGVGYAGHPRMEKLLEQNGIKAKDYLNGQQEADAFANRECVKLHMSTLRKVDVFANILNRAVNNTLKVQSKWTEIYGISIQGVLPVRNFVKVSSKIVSITIKGGNKMERQIYGYVRVSTKEQNEARQLVAMREFGVPEKNILIEKQSGKDFDRPKYQRLLRKLKPGDTLVIKSIDRLGRNYDEILEQWRVVTKKKEAAIVVLDMPLLDTRQGRDLTGTLIADIVLQLLSYVAQTEREFIHQRQAEGIAAAKARGVQFGRSPMEVPEKFNAVFAQWQSGELSARKAARQLSVSNHTFSKWATVAIQA